MAWITGVIAILISLFTLILLYLRLQVSPCPYLRNCIQGGNKPHPTPRSLLITPKLKCDTLELQTQSRSEVGEQSEAVLPDEEYTNHE
jgi:hypothetical protein